MSGIERQKIAERENLDFDEKEHVAAKSGHKCCHCGKEVYYGYGATIEHFIPLSKGGTNRDINLVMLCEDCNKAKKDLIIKPEDYLTYLNDEDKEKLAGYFKSYTQSFEYITRDNLFACDQYTLKVLNPAHIKMLTNNRKINCPPKGGTVVLKRATVDALPKLMDYYEKYLRKYDCLGEREDVERDIRFWFQFGCIYYIEAADGIKVMAPVTVVEVTDDIIAGHALSIFPMAYYDTEQAFILCDGIVFKVSEIVSEEQGLDQLPILLNAVKADKISMAVIMRDKRLDKKDSTLLKGASLVRRYIIMDMSENGSLPKPADDQKLQAFFKKFANIKDEIIAWAGKEDNADWYKELIVVS